MSTRTVLFRRGGLLVALGVVFALVTGSAQAASQTAADPSDAPAGPSGKADLRAVSWDVGDTSATLKVSLDASTYPGGRADIGVHVLLDTNADGIADQEIAATRNADGLAVDVALRNLDRTLSTADCQDLAGKPSGAQGKVATTIADGLETFSFSFDPALVSGRLAAFRWAAFGQAPPDGAQAGPWDVMPDAANPDPNASNPGDRRCDSSKGGVPVRMSQGVVFPDPPPPDPNQPPGSSPPPGPGPAPAPVVVLALPGGQPQAGTPATIDASGTTVAAGAHVVAYEWDVNGDGHIDTNTGTNPVVHLMPGSGRETVIATVIDSNFVAGTATIVLSPGASAAGCESEASIGILRIRAACIRRTGAVTVANPVPSERLWENYVVEMNGISLVTRDAHATVEFNETTGEIIGHGQFRVMSLNSPNGDILWYDSGPGGFTWPMPSGVRGTPHMVSLSIEENCVEHESTACASVGGFPVTGEIGVGIDTGTLDAVLDVQVSVDSGITVTGGTRLRLNLALGGITLDSIRFSVENATFGVLTLHRLAFAYEPPGTGEPAHEGDMWDVHMDLGFQSPPFRVAGRMIFTNGRFNYAGADLMFTPGILIYPAVFLNRFAGSFGIDPIRFGGGLGASFASIIQVNVNWAYVGFRDGTRALRGDGIATLVGGELANFHMDFWSDGYFAFSGRLGYSYPAEGPGFQLFGQTDFWVEAQPDGVRARYQGDGDLSVRLGPVSSSAHVFFNNDWAAGCLLLMKFVHSYRDGIPDIYQISPRCDISEYAIQPLRRHEGILPPEASAAHSEFTGLAAPALAAPEGRAIKVVRGQPALVLQVAGEGGVPKVALADPKGRVYTPTEEAYKVVTAGAFSSATLTQQAVTLLRVEKPIAGDWTVTPLPGSPPIKGVTAANVAAAVKVKARVRGSGRTRTLTWNGPRLAGRKIRFTERAKDVGNTIVVTDKGSGSVPFTLQGGSAGGRTIEAQVIGAEGIPLATTTVARFRAPGPPRPGRSGLVKVTRTGETVTVRWLRIRGAQGYSVKVSGSDGRKEIHFPAAKTQKLLVLRVAPTTKLKVSVAGWIGTESITGRPRVATLRAVKPKGRKPKAKR